jgi:hypothetical protein
MGEFKGMKELLAGRHFDRRSSSCTCTGIYATSSASVIELR